MQHKKKQKPRSAENTFFFFVINMQHKKKQKPRSAENTFFFFVINMRLARNPDMMMWRLFACFT